MLIVGIQREKADGRVFVSILFIEQRRNGISCWHEVEQKRIALVH